MLQINYALTEDESECAAKFYYNNIYSRKRQSRDNFFRQIAYGSSRRWNPEHTWWLFIIWFSVLTFCMFVIVISSVGATNSREISSVFWAVTFFWSFTLIGLVWSCVWRKICINKFARSCSTDEDIAHMFLGDENVEFITKGERLIYAYGDILSVYEYPDGLYISLGSERFKYMPARAFTPCTAQSVTDMLINKLGKRYYRIYYMLLPNILTVD